MPVPAGTCRSAAEVDSILVGTLAAVAFIEAVGLAVLSLLLLRSRAEVARLRGDEAKRPSALGSPQAVETVADTANPVGAEGLVDMVLSSIEQLADWVTEAETPELAHLMPTENVVILFCDIENSTALNVRMGDRAWVELIERNATLIRELVDEHHGHVVKSQGDGFMVAFEHPNEAVRCSVAVQHALNSDADTAPDQAIRMRIGIHMGRSVQHGDDLYGRNVALAARVTAEAHGGETLVSQTVHDAVCEELTFGAAREAEFKGFTGVFRVYPVEPTLG
jgi:class 3 adenylate cyclase